MRKSKFPKVTGYIRTGNRYVSLSFIASALAAFLLFGTIYLIFAHKTIVCLWLEHQTLPKFMPDSPYLADYSGQAVLLLPDGTKLYEGELKNGVAEGFGELYENDELRYIGEFADNKYNGIGTLFDGEKRYYGNFENNSFHGEGTLTNVVNGSQFKYIGAFKNGVKSGSGSLYRDGMIVYEGGFADNTYDGQGKEYLDGVLIYDGGFLAGRFNGDGTEYNPLTGFKLFEGKYSAGERMAAGIQFDEYGDLTVTPTKYLDPTSLLNSEYDDVLVTLIKATVSYREQIFDGKRFIVDDLSGTVWELSTDGDDARVTAVYLCGQGSWGTVIVGLDINDSKSKGTERIRPLTSSETFAMSIANTLLGKETLASELAVKVFTGKGSNGEAQTAAAFFVPPVEPEPEVVPELDLTAEASEVKATPLPVVQTKQPTVPKPGGKILFLKIESK
jgi:hypothetical protein